MNFLIDAFFKFRPNTKSSTDWLGGKQWDGGSSREGSGVAAREGASAAGKAKSTANLSASAANIYQASLTKKR